MAALFDGSRRGRPPKLSKDEADEAVATLREDPRSIKKAVATTNETTGKEISEWTLKRIAKSAELRWKRMRKSVKGKRNQAEFEHVKAEISTLHEQEAAGELEVYYFDESGFSLIPEVPYAWQAVGETIEIPSSRSKRLNVLGFCNKQQDFHATTVQGYVDSEIVIACFDRFCGTINKNTVVIVDNASMHTSGKFKGKLEEWAENGLTVKYLPTYSPELNLIEIVWPGLFSSKFLAMKANYDRLMGSSYILGAKPCYKAFCLRSKTIGANKGYVTNRDISSSLVFWLF
jgi:hypothetical protein